MIRVGSSKNGSMTAVVASGIIRTMSDSLMPSSHQWRSKHFAFFKEFGVYLMSRNCDVLFFTFSIGEAQINKLHFMFVQHRQNVFSLDILNSPDFHCRRGNEVFNFYQGGYEAIFCRIL